MGRVASSVDNSMIESFWSTLQRELLDTRSWNRPEDLASAISERIEAWYNPRRRHTALQMLAPHQYETLHTAAVIAADHHTTLSGNGRHGARHAGFERLATFPD